MARRAQKIVPVHPGEVLLEEFLKPLGITQQRLARDTGIPPRRINEIVRGRRAITAETALRLARHFGTTDRFWLNLQAHYDLEVEKERLASRLEREVTVREPNRNPGVLLMSGKPGFQWSRHRVPASLAALVGTVVAALLYAAPADGVPTALLSPRVVVGVIEDGQLLLTVNLPPAASAPVRGTLSVELLDARGNVLGEDRWGLRLGAQAAGPAFRFDAPRAPEQVRVRCRFREESLVVPLASVLLVRGHETTVSAGEEFLPASKAAFRCEVRGVRSATETVPLAGAAVRARLLGPEGKRWPRAQGTRGRRAAAAGYDGFHRPRQRQGS